MVEMLHLLQVRVTDERHKVTLSNGLNWQIEGNDGTATIENAKN